MADAQDNPNGSPLSLKRLTAAFAQMLGGSPDGENPLQEPVARDPCEISPRTIVEGILFVGSQDGGRLTAEQLAGRMRDVTPDEVVEAITELNQQYLQDGAAYQIEGGLGGFSMTLRPELARIRDKFYGRIKEARLSPKALEVLSVVAYRQPTTAKAIDQLRGARSGTLLTQLVRRGLLRREAPPEAPNEPHYTTTDRFLHYFRLDDIKQLPRAAELDD